MRGGLQSGDYTPTPVERLPPQKLLGELRALQDHLRRVEVVAYVALAMGVGLFAGAVIVMLMNIMRG